MPDFIQQRRGPLHAEMEQKRGKFFPFFDRLQNQTDHVSIAESLGTVVDNSGTVLKYSTDTSSSSEDQQLDTTVEDVGFPNIIAEFAPHNTFNEGKYAPSGFTDITQFIKGVSGSLRKRTYEIGRFEAGSLSVELDNNDGRFTPSSPRSPYFPDIKANRRFRIRGKNMQNPNVATGGGKYLNTVGFRKGTGIYASDFAIDPELGTHPLFWLPPGIGTSHIETTLAYQADIATHDLLEFYAPIELGVRLSHSAYVWLVSGREAPDSIKEFIIVYYDADGNELTPINDNACTYKWTDTPTTPMRVSISDQPPALAKYGLIRLRVTHRSAKNMYSDVTYAISGIQTELPENNYAPLMDSINFTIEGAGNIYEDGDDGVTIGWGAGAAGATFRVPHMIPGETYTFAATINKQGVDLIMTADEGFSGAILDSEDSTIDVAATFVANRTEEIIKFIPLQPLPSTAANLALGKTVTGTGQSGCQGAESPDKAVNGSWTGGLTDKFCSHVSPGRLTVDLGEPRDIQGFIVRHARAGGETANYNSKDFNIYVSDDNTNFTQVVAVLDNTDDTTLHPVICRGRYVKLEVTTPTQIGDTATRIYEFEVYAAEGLLPSTSGAVLTVHNITVRKGEYPDVQLYPPLPNGSSATEEENGVTEWEEPKPIFDGWTEDWPATAEDHTSSTSITVNDRIARLGNISLSHTLREALFHDEAELIIPFDDDPIDSQGLVSNLGEWSATNGMATLKITGMNGDLTGASYAQGIAGPTTDNATQFNRQTTGSYLGYVVPIPFTAEFIPKLNPPTNPTGPLPLPSEGFIHTKNYYAVWSHTYKESGTLKTPDDSSFIYQGDCTLGDASCSGNGDLRSLVGFNYLGIIQDLTGKKIRYVGLSVHAEQWWWFTGGYGIFGTHNYLDRYGPQTWSGSRVDIARWRTPLFRRDSWQTFSLGVEVASEFITGVTTGISVGPALSSSLNYYGSFTGAGQRYKPYLTIQYTD